MLDGIGDSVTITYYIKRLKDTIGARATISWNLR
jgi:hypothetical protein